VLVGLYDRHYDLADYKQTYVRTRDEPCVDLSGAITYSDLPLEDLGCAAGA